MRYKLHDPLTVCILKPTLTGKYHDNYHHPLQVKERRELASYAIAEFGLSERQACRTVQVSRCAHRYQAKRTADEPITKELQELADRQPGWGCSKMSDYLRNQGHTWNHTKAHPQSVPSNGTASEEKTEETGYRLALPRHWRCLAVRTRPGRWIS